MWCRKTGMLSVALWVERERVLMVTWLCLLVVVGSQDFSSGSFFSLVQ